MTPKEGAKEIVDKIDCPECPKSFDRVVEVIIQQCVDDAVEKAVDEERERDMPQYGKGYLNSLWPWNR